jgi:DNA repair and recombination RAD54-like protein
LDELPCKRRILLSGTPLQNDLKEFYAMVNFTNPEILGDRRAFTRVYESPILRGREPDATATEIKIGNDRSGQLSAIVNQFILRRTNALLSAHLPPKVVQVVCCRMTPLQSKLYRHFVHSKAVRSAMEGEKSGVQVLPLITALKNLCNHPKLLYDQKSNTKGNP